MRTPCLLLQGLLRQKITAAIPNVSAGALEPATQRLAVNLGYRSELNLRGPELACRLECRLPERLAVPEQKIHSSGHACGPAIFEMITKINPQKLYPIHTTHLEAFKTLRNITITYPEYGKKITI